MIVVVQMAPRNPGTKVSQKGPTPKQRTAEGLKRPEHGPDRLGKARQAADNILASWALQELVAERASEVTHG